jgi:hypothetical protein
MNVGEQSTCFGSENQRVAADLTDAALGVAARHGVRGSSVDVELDLWHALDRAALAKKPAHLREQCSGALTRAAYDIVLRRGFSGSFVDMELDLWQTLRGALQPN